MSEQSSETKEPGNEPASTRKADSAPTPQNPPGASTVPPEKQSPPGGERCCSEHRAL